MQTRERQPIPQEEMPAEEGIGILAKAQGRRFHLPFMLARTLPDHAHFTDAGLGGYPESLRQEIEVILENDMMDENDKALPIHAAHARFLRKAEIEPEHVYITLGVNPPQTIDTTVTRGNNLWSAHATAQVFSMHDYVVTFKLAEPYRGMIPQEEQLRDRNLQMIVNTTLVDRTELLSEVDVVTLEDRESMEQRITKYVMANIPNFRRTYKISNVPTDLDLLVVSPESTAFLRALQEGVKAAA